MADFNGQYEALSAKREQLTDAHRDALELLDIVHRICRKEKLTYSLAEAVMIGCGAGRAFADLPPNISLMMKYEYFKRLRRELELFTEKNPNYMLSDMENSRQFDSLALWFAKRSKVSLPEERKQDEIYYAVHITILPVFYAGNNQLEFVRKTKSYTEAMKALNARASLPQRTFVTKIRKLRKIMYDTKYRGMRDSVNLPELKRTLEKRTESKFCFFPAPMKLSGIIKITLEELDTIEEVSVAGIVCYISRYANAIAKRYPREYRESVLKYRVSDLIRKGGENLRRVQLIQTEMLREFDRICRKNKIRYNIAFGTLLGAVRHKGFIPWDDDVDVIVPFEDYMRLDEAMKNDLDTSRFFWRTMDTETDFNLTFKHMKRNGTVYMKPGRDKFTFHKGILIDVFPVFPAANNRIAHWIQTRLCFFYRTATWAYMGADSERKVWKRFCYRWMAKPGPRQNLESFLKCATMFPKKNSYYSYYNATFRSPYHISYLSDEAFDSPIELEFEGCRFLAPSKYQEALSYCFGADYNLYPSKRWPSHFAILDLGGLYDDLTDEKNEGGGAVL